VLPALVRPGMHDRGDGDLRALEPGDLGWVVERHGAIYADEFGWNTDFEGLVARIVADYHDHHRPGRDNAWIATVDGARAGCVRQARRRMEMTGHHAISSVQTLKLASSFGPKVCVIGTSQASRP